MSALHENDWHEIGKHSLRFEAPDIVHMRVVGDMTLPQIKQIFNTAESFPMPEKGFFSLIDIPQAGRPNLEILKSDEILKQLQSYRAMVYYRAQFKHRTVIELVQRISHGLKLAMSTMPLVAFATEEEGRAWIESHR